MLGPIKVTNLNLKLESLKIIDILLNMILSKKLETKSLKLFHVSKSLVVHDGFIKVVRVVAAKDLDEVLEQFFDVSELILVGFVVEHIVIWSLPLLFGMLTNRLGFFRCLP